MKKLLTTLALALAILGGGLAFTTGAASAAECQPFTACDPFTQPTTPTCAPFTPCPPPAPACEPFSPCANDREFYLSQQLVSAEQTANEYRLQVVALTAEAADLRATVTRVQRLADRRAATIQRLRAKIRALR